MARQRRRAMRAFGSQRGVVLLFTFILTFLLTALTVTFLDTISFEEKRTRFSLVDKQVLNTAEAGLHKALWYLENRSPDNTQDGSWRGTVAETVGGNTYTVTVSNLNLATGASATASSSQPTRPASKAIDLVTGTLSSFWRSSGPASQWIRISFPANSDFYINSVQLTVTGTGRPQDYEWWAGNTVGSLAPVFTAGHPSCGGSDTWVDTFLLSTGVNYLELRVNAVCSGTDVRVDEIAVNAIQIQSVCTITSGGQAVTQTVTQKAIVDTCIGTCPPQVSAQPKTWRWF